MAVSTAIPGFLAAALCPAMSLQGLVKAEADCDCVWCESVLLGRSLTSGQQLALLVGAVWAPGAHSRETQTVTDFRFQRT